MIYLLSSKIIWNISDLQKTPEHLLEKELDFIWDHQVMVGMLDASIQMSEDLKNTSSLNLVMVANGSTGCVPVLISKIVRTFIFMLHLHFLSFYFLLSVLLDHQF